IRFLQAVRDALKKPALWESRPLDISYVLDALPAVGNRVPGLLGKIDAGRVGVGGHSMGSYTTETIAGALVDLPGQPGRNFGDPRVKAVLCLSPQGPGQFGLSDHSFDRISLPYMGMTGSLDGLGPVASPAWHKTPFERSQPGDKYHLFIKARTTCRSSGRAHSCLDGPSKAEIFSNTRIPPRWLSGTLT